jgi:hypothetical protein
MKRHALVKDCGFRDNCGGEPTVLPSEVVAFAERILQLDNEAAKLAGSIPSHWTTPHLCWDRTYSCCPQYHFDTAEIELVLDQETHLHYWEAVSCWHCWQRQLPEVDPSFPHPISFSQRADFKTGPNRSHVRSKNRIPILSYPLIGTISKPIHMKHKRLAQIRLEDMNVASYKVRTPIHSIMASEHTRMVCAGPMRRAYPFATYHHLRKLAGISFDALIGPPFIPMLQD